MSLRSMATTAAEIVHFVAWVVLASALSLGPASGAAPPRAGGPRAAASPAPGGAPGGGLGVRDSARGASSAGDPRLFIVEQAGRIRILRAGRLLPPPSWTSRAR